MSRSYEEVEKTSVSAELVGWLRRSRLPESMDLAVRALPVAIAAILLSFLPAQISAQAASYGVGSATGEELFRSADLSVSAPDRRLEARMISPIDLRAHLSPDPPPLSFSVAALSAPGTIRLDGGSGKPVARPFEFDWGDGSRPTQGQFGNAEATHRYRDVTRNYVATVTAFFHDGSTVRAQRAVRFVPPRVEQIQLPPDLAVQIPDHPPALRDRVPGFDLPSGAAFGDRDFGLTGRAIVEYVFSCAAVIQDGMVKGHVARPLKQVVLRSNGYSAAWYSTPLVVFAHPDGFRPGHLIPYTYFFHEMGHNFTLNTPESFRMGGKLDGPANAVVSETLASIFEFVTAHELVRRAEEFGLPEDISADINQAAAQVIRGVVNGHQRFAGFQSWNDPCTGEDETEPTFLSLAYRFLHRAADPGRSETPAATAGRMLQFLQGFNENWRQRYNPASGSYGAERFRATLLVAAFSAAFEADLRSDFPRADFPVDDDIFDELDPLP